MIAKIHNNFKDASLTFGVGCTYRDKLLAESQYFKILDIF
jgi:hypothetical protein